MRRAGGRPEAANGDRRRSGVVGRSWSESRTTGSRLPHLVTGAGLPTAGRECRVHANQGDTPPRTRQLQRAPARLNHRAQFPSHRIRCRTRQTSQRQSGVGSSAHICSPFPLLGQQASPPPDRNQDTRPRPGASCCSVGRLRLHLQGRFFPQCRPTGRDVVCQRWARMSGSSAGWYRPQTSRVRGE